MDRNIYAPIAAATLVVVLAMVGCAWWIGRQSAAAVPADYSWRLQEMQSQLYEIKKNTACVSWQVQLATAKQLLAIEALGPNPC
jgi:uncharacterized membrane protein YfbV (UPF0208 family)